MMILLAVSLIAAPTAGLPWVIKGSCLPKSSIGSGSAKSDLEGNAVPFHCNAAVVTDLPNGRTSVQFTSSGPGAKVITFGGIVSSVRPEMEVDHLYLNDGHVMHAGQGRCTFDLTDKGDMNSIVCGARVESGEAAIVAVVGFQAN